MDWLPDFLKSFLPTPWSRRVTTTSWSIALVLLFLPELLSKIGLPPIDQETLMLRLLGIVTILFLGSFISLYLVARAYHAKEKQHTEVLERQRQLFESTAKDKKKRNDDFTKPLKIDTRYVV